MTMEYRCSCGKSNVPQYGMVYINHSSIEQLCSIFAYINEWNVDIEVFDIGVFIQRLNQFGTITFELPLTANRGEKLADPAEMLITSLLANTQVYLGNQLLCLSRLIAANTDKTSLIINAQNAAIENLIYNKIRLQARVKDANTFDHINIDKTHGYTSISNSIKIIQAINRDIINATKYLYTMSKQIDFDIEDTIDTVRRRTIGNTSIMTWFTNVNRMRTTDSPPDTTKWAHKAQDLSHVKQGTGFTRTTDASHFPMMGYLGSWTDNIKNTDIFPQSFGYKESYDIYIDRLYIYWAYKQLSLWSPDFSKHISPLGQGASLQQYQRFLSKLFESHIPDTLRFSSVYGQGVLIKDDSRGINKLFDLSLQDAVLSANGYLKHVLTSSIVDIRTQYGDAMINSSVPDVSRYRKDIAKSQQYTCLRYNDGIVLFDPMYTAHTFKSGFTQDTIRHSYLSPKPSYIKDTFKRINSKTLNSSLLPMYFGETYDRALLKFPDVLNSTRSWNDITIDSLFKSYNKIAGEFNTITDTVTAYKADKSIYISQILGVYRGTIRELRLVGMMLDALKHSRRTEFSTDILNIFKDVKLSDILDTLDTAQKDIKPVFNTLSEIVYKLGSILDINESDVTHITKNASQAQLLKAMLEAYRQAKPAQLKQSLSTEKHSVDAGMQETLEDVSKVEVDTRVNLDLGGISPQRKATDSEMSFISIIKSMFDVQLGIRELLQMAGRTNMSVDSKLLHSFLSRDFDMLLNPGSNMYSAPERNIQLLHDLELVLTNPLFKDIMIANDAVKFGGVTETDEVFDWEIDDSIDELLIPNSDFPYDSMRERIFDFKTGKPIKPVEIIDSHTFVAVMPTIDPIQVEWDIGREYVDVEVTWLKYMIEIFYQTWQRNIFKYGALSMIEGINTMLEYMKVYARAYAPGSALKQCERAISLIRWYAEHIILKHSKVIIHVEYSDWKSNLHTGVIDCDHELENLEVNGTFTLQNTSNNAKIVLRNYVCIDGFLSFSIALNGEAAVYINGEHINTLETGCESKQSYAIESGTLKFEIIFTGTSIMLGNIVIENTSVSDISTEFKYDPGKANFGIHQVLQSVRSYYQLSEDNYDDFVATRDGLIGLNDLSNKLIEYLELHHKGKQKGKRLTIKRL